MYKKYFFKFVLSVIIIFSACSNSVPVKVRPGQKLINTGRFSELVLKGDSEFKKMHWMGWSNSIRIFKDALKIRDSKIA